MRGGTIHGEGKDTPFVSRRLYHAQSTNAWKQSPKSCYPNIIHAIILDETQRLLTVKGLHTTALARIERNGRMGTKLASDCIIKHVGGFSFYRSTYIWSNNKTSYLSQTSNADTMIVRHGAMDHAHICVSCIVGAAMSTLHDV